MTPNERSDELINREIDGLLDGAELQELDNLARSDAEVAERRRDLHRTAGLLSRMEARPAPADLRADIMAAVADRNRVTGTGSPVISIPRTRSRMKHGLSFAVGLAAGIALFATYAVLVIEGPTSDPMQAIGSILPGERLTAGNTVQTEQITAGGITAACATHRIGDIVAVEVTTGTGPCSVDIRFDDAALQFVGLDPQSETAVSLLRNTGSIALDAKGAVELRLLFVARTAVAGPVTIVLNSEDDTRQAELATHRRSD